MDSKLWTRRALSTCLCVAILATYSMVTLAFSGKVAGELTVFGANTNGEAPYVMVNGEAAHSGRSIFSSSIVTTPDNAGAVINLGKLGKIELAPNSTFVLSFNNNAISGDLTAGKLTVLGSATAVNVKTADGGSVDLNAGESATATGAKAQTSGGSGKGWWIFAAVLVGAGAAIIWAATQDNDVQIGGGGTVVSPVR
jgi:hypothetical protein